MTNEEIVSEVQRGVNVKDNMSQLYDQNRGIISRIVNRYRNLTDADDLMQEAYIALDGAARRYDPESGVLFVTFAYKTINGHLIRYLHQNTSCKRVPDHLWSDVGTVRTFMDRYRDQHGMNPDDTEIRKATGISARRLNDVRLLMDEPSTVSLDAPISGLDGVLLGETIPSPVDLEYTVCGQIWKDQDHTKLWKAVQDLPDRQQDIITAVYREGRSVTDLAREQHVTEGRIRQLIQKGLKRLAVNEEVKRIAADYEMVARSYHGGLHTFQTTRTSCVEYAAISHLEYLARYAALHRDIVRMQHGEFSPDFPQFSPKFSPVEQVSDNT